MPPGRHLPSWGGAGARTPASLLEGDALSWEGLTMEWLCHFFEQVLDTVVFALPRFLDWVITRLRG